MNKIEKGINRMVHYFLEEWKYILKDRGVLLVLFIAVWVYPLVYSIAYQNNVIRDIPVTVVNQDNSALSRQLIRMVDATQEIKVSQEGGDFAEAERTFQDGVSKGILVIPIDFEKHILKGEQTHVGIYCDAGYFLIYKETLKGSLRAMGTLSAGIEIKRLTAGGLPLEKAMEQREPLAVRTYMLYNPAGSYGSYVMPGLILVILQQTLLVGIGMIGGGRREKHFRAGHTALDETSSILFALTGRSLAYFTLYCINLLFTQIILFSWFGFPDTGSLLAIWILMIPFLFSVIFMGMTTSLLLKRREHSIMLLVFLSPVVLFLSGVSWPASSLPPLLYKISHIFPTTSMIPAYLRIRTMGGTLADVKPELTFLLLQMIVYGLAAAASYRIYLHRRK